MPLHEILPWIKSSQNIHCKLHTARCVPFKKEVKGAVGGEGGWGVGVTSDGKRREWK